MDLAAIHHPSQAHTGQSLSTVFSPFPVTPNLDEFLVRHLPTFSLLCVVSCILFYLTHHPIFLGSYPLLPLNFVLSSALVSRFPVLLGESLGERVPKVSVSQSYRFPKSVVPKVTVS